MADLDRVREALRASMTAWATQELRDDQAHVVAVPDLDLLVAHLERLEPTWNIGWACDSVQPFVVRAALTVFGVCREGLASAPTLEDARLLALSDAARLFGVLPNAEGHWVEYDAEEGANTADLEAEAPLPAALPISLPPEPPRDPQMEKARRHIEDLLEQLKAAGKAGDAARILMRGYGETLDESRAIYKELQGVLKNGTGG